MAGEAVVDLQTARSWAQGARSLAAVSLPATLLELLHAGEGVLEYLSRLMVVLEDENPLHLKGAARRPVAHDMQSVRLYPPLLRPLSLRDFYAFEAHVKTAHEARGRQVPEEWYRFPVFYFSNANAIFGPDEPIPYPASSQALDYELEIACVVGRAGRDIPLAQAADHIFGYTVFNDWSARDIQREEMKVGLGPAKGKDFASSLGPWILTPDELAEQATERPGVYDLEMVARVNGVERSRGNWGDIHYSFAEMIARASADTYLLPGEVLGSGTVGSGSLLELTRGEGPWLQPGDVVELEVEKLGVLRNVVAQREATSMATEQGEAAQG